MTLDEEKKIAHDILTDYLSAKHMRKTPERFRLLDVIYDQQEHFSADELVLLMPSEFKVSRATVYNSLELFVECQLVVKHQFDKQHIEYEKVTSNSTHHHRICTRCGSVREFTDLKLKKAIQSRTFNAFQVTHYSLYLYGVCKKCATKYRAQKQ